ncbi:hypothetical protein F4780DRAFT_747734 [Xylariomycetidae sp. FL0641]|nr:hypothetical protein F4780DRAFT_747734 [Xylariomycetidae sp. FL0641]
MAHQQRNPRPVNPFSVEAHALSQAMQKMKQAFDTLGNFEIEDTKRGVQGAFLRALRSALAAECTGEDTMRGLDRETERCLFQTMGNVIAHMQKTRGFTSLANSGFSMQGSSPKYPIRISVIDIFMVVGSKDELVYRTFRKLCMNQMSCCLELRKGEADRAGRDIPKGLRDCEELLNAMNESDLTAKDANSVLDASEDQPRRKRKRTDEEDRTAPAPGGNGEEASVSNNAACRAESRPTDEMSQRAVAWNSACAPATSILSRLTPSADVYGSDVGGILRRLHLVLATTRVSATNLEERMVSGDLEAAKWYCARCLCLQFSSIAGPIDGDRQCATCRQGGMNCLQIRMLQVAGSKAETRLIESEAV